MDSDMMFVAGLVLLLFAVTSLLAALADRRRPVAGLMLGMAGGGMVAYAVTSQRGGYRVEEIPEVVYRVIGALVN